MRILAEEPRTLPLTEGVFVDLRVHGSVVNIDVLVLPELLVSMIIVEVLSGVEVVATASLLGCLPLFVHALPRGDLAARLRFLSRSCPRFALLGVARLTSERNHQSVHLLDLPALLILLAEEQTLLVQHLFRIALGPLLTPDNDILSILVFSLVTRFDHVIESVLRRLLNLVLLYAKIGVAFVVDGENGLGILQSHLHLLRHVLLGSISNRDVSWILLNQHASAVRENADARGRIFVLVERTLPLVLKLCLRLVLFSERRPLGSVYVFVNFQRLFHSLAYPLL